MSTTKQAVQRLLENLPDDVSLEEIQYHIYVRQKVEQGLEDAAEGRAVTQAQAEKRMARWLEP